MKKLALAVALAVLFPLAAGAQERATTKDAERMVHKAVEYLKKEGKEKAFAVFSDPKGPFTYRDLYVFVISQEGVILAHGSKPALVGMNNINGRDPDGKYYTREVVALAKEKGSGWTEFKYENPATHKVEPKVVYIELVDGVIIGCGAFKP